MRNVKALAFDVGGTVFDWQTPICEAVQALAQARSVTVDPQRFALEWRRGMFAVLAQVRQGTLPWMNADAMHRRALDGVAEQHPELNLSRGERDELNRVWHRMRAWPEFPEALARLRRRYTVIVLTVLSWAIAVDCSRASGIQWDGVLSCEFLGHYKPEREAYLAAARLLGLEPGRVAMVAVHPGDLRAAKAAVFKTVYVAPRLDEPDLPGFAQADEDEFDLSASDFSALAETLCA